MEENFGGKKTLANGLYCRVGEKNFGESTLLQKTLTTQMPACVSNQ